MTVQITELRFPVSGAALESFRMAVNNTRAWPEIFGKILTAPSAVWARNKPETQIWALLRVDQVRTDYRLLFRFLNADTGEDLHLGGVSIEHGGSQIANPMLHASMPSMIAAKGMYGVRGETRMHHGFAVSSLRGVFPQARTIVVKLALPKGVTSPVIAVPEVVEQASQSEFGRFRGNSSHRIADENPLAEERSFPRRQTFPHDRDLERSGRVYRG